MLRIIPKASNAFDVELLRWNGKKYVVVGRLDFHSDGGELYVINREGDLKIKWQREDKKGIVVPRLEIEAKNDEGNTRNR